MVFVLGSYVYSSINSARRNAHDHREKMWGEVMESRKRLGLEDHVGAVGSRKGRREAGLGDGVVEAEGGSKAG